MNHSGRSLEYVRHIMEAIERIDDYTADKTIRNNLPPLHLRLAEVVKELESAERTP